MRWVEVTKSQHEAGTLIQEKPQTEVLKEHVQDAAKTRIKFFKRAFQEWLARRSS